MGDFEQANLGGNGGDPFNMTLINGKTITLKGGNKLDSIRIGNDQHGGNGGHTPLSLLVDDDCWIREINVRAGQKIDFLQLVPTKGNPIQAGGGGGDPYTYTGIKLLGIGGKAGRVVDSLELLYIRDYKPTTVVETDAVAIYGVKTRGDYTIFAQEQSKSMDSFATISEKFESSMDASAKADFLTGGYSGAASLVANSLKQTSTKVREELRNHSTTEKIKIKDDELGILFGSCQIRESSKGRFPVPNGPWTLKIVHKFEWSQMFVNYYDLTNIALETLNAASKACYRKENRGGMTYLTCK